MGDLSELPGELIDNFLKRLCHIEDIVRFEAVCKSWQSVVAASRKAGKLVFPPYLMLTDDEADAQNLRTFYCISSQRDVTIRLPDIHGRRCWGSSFGWLVTYGLDLNLHLLNPFSGVRLCLPHQSTVPNQYPRPHEVEPEYFRQCCPERFVLSSPPDPNQPESCFVLAIFQPYGKLSFAKPGDQAWTAIETPGPFPWYQDVIYFSGQFYAIDGEGILTVCDINSSNPKGTRLDHLPPRDEFRHDKLYLFEMFGELHLLERFHNEVEVEDVQDKGAVPDAYSITEKFVVYKFDFQTKRWIQVSDSGHYALFVGSNSSFVISTYEYPDFKRNAIYYSDDNSGTFHRNFCDMAVYDLKMKRSQPFYSGAKVLSKFSRPLFIVPNL